MYMCRQHILPEIRVQERLTATRIEGRTPDSPSDWRPMTTVFSADRSPSFSAEPKPTPPPSAR